MNRWIGLAGLVFILGCPKPEPSPTPPPTPTDCKCQIPARGSGWFKVDVDVPYNVQFLQVAKQNLGDRCGMDVNLSADLVAANLADQNICAASWGSGSVIISRPDGSFGEYLPFDVSGCWKDDLSATFVEAWDNANALGCGGAK